LQILARGGLGNQLFQFAFIHGYADKFLGSDIGIIPDSESMNQRADRPFDLGPLVKHCEHVKVVNQAHPVNHHKMKLQFYRIRERILFRAFTNLIPIVSLVELHEKAEFEYSNPRKRLFKMNLPIKGYFQNWRYVERVWPKIQKELEATLSEFERKVDNLKSSGQKYIVLHIRGGDYLTSQHIYGEISDAYYLKAIEFAKTTANTPIRLLISTNDEEFAISYMKSMEMQEYEILNPLDYTAWETLAVMAKATGVICANSTLSWWGGFLCLKNGGFCIVPSPWSKKRASRSTEAMVHPQFFSFKTETL
jgi:hypothetical protein